MAELDSAERLKMDDYRPTFCRRRVFALEPKAALTLGGGFEKEITLKVAWEEGLQKGPIGEYFRWFSLNREIPTWDY